MVFKGGVNFLSVPTFRWVLAFCDWEALWVDGRDCFQAGLTFFFSPSLLILRIFPKPSRNKNNNRTTHTGILRRADLTGLKFLAALTGLAS